MYPEYPYPGFTWQVSQHIAVVRESYFLGLLQACSHLDGLPVDIEDIDGKIAEQGIISSETGRSIWRDYQQVLGEFGFMYATGVVGNTIQLTPIAKEFLGGKITFSEALTNQLLKYQYPNGKTTLSKGLKEAFVGVTDTFSSLTDLQEHYDIKVRPLPFVWLVLEKMHEKTGQEWSITSKEIAEYIFRCRDYDDLDACSDDLIELRQGGEEKPLPSWEVKRNALDWSKLMGMTRFFDKANSVIRRSKQSIRRATSVKMLFEFICDTSSFWINDSQDVSSWYEYFGSVTDPIRELIIQNGKQLWDFFPSIITCNILNKHKALLEG